MHINKIRVFQKAFKATIDSFKSIFHSV